MIEFGPIKLQSQVFMDSGEVDLLNNLHSEKLKIQVREEGKEFLFHIYMATILEYFYVCMCECVYVCICV